MGFSEYVETKGDCAEQARTQVLGACVPHPKSKQSLIHFSSCCPCSIPITINLTINEIDLCGLAGEICDPDFRL